MLISWDFQFKVVRRMKRNILYMQYICCKKSFPIPFIYIFTETDQFYLWIRAFFILIYALYIFVFNTLLSDIRFLLLNIQHTHTLHSRHSSNNGMVSESESAFRKPIINPISYPFRMYFWQTRIEEEWRGESSEKVMRYYYVLLLYHSVHSDRIL